MTVNAAWAARMERHLVSVERLVDMKRAPTFRSITRRTLRVLREFRRARGSARAQRERSVVETYRSFVEAFKLISETALNQPFNVRRNRRPTVRQMQREARG
jgi:hypothetical protein